MAAVFRTLVGLALTFVLLAAGLPAQALSAGAGSISGRITVPEGMPPAGITVRASLAEEDVISDYEATADESGYYVLPDLPGGSFWMSTSAADFRLIDNITPKNQYVKLAYGEQRTDFDIAISVGATVSGRFTAPEGTDFDCLWLQAVAGDGPDFSAYLDGNGNYTFTRLPAGTYSVVMNRTGRVPGSAAVTGSGFTVGYGQTVTGFDLELPVLGPCDPTFAPRFFDVADGTQFAEEIHWLAAEGIATGWFDGSYRPFQAVNRDAMAAFIYRLAGSPWFEWPAKPAFTDVPNGVLFRKEMLWLADRGISEGWPDRTYRPWQPVNRDAMAAFLYRLAGSPEFVPPAESPFLDVAVDHQFYKEIAWLVSTEISTGWPDGTFRPDTVVYRDAMAAFMYRYAARFH